MEIIHTESDGNRPIPLGVLLSIAIVIIVLISLFSLSRVYAEESMVSSDSCACIETATLVCHIPLNNIDPMHSIRIGEAAIEAHLAHGDTLGACSGEAENAQQFEKQCICSNGEMGYLAYTDEPGDKTYMSVAMNFFHLIPGR